MGKSAAADMLRQLGVMVYDADAAVHRVFAKGGAAVGPVGEAFPEAVVDGAVDRTVLSKKVVDDEAAFKRLESIVHPIVRGEQEKFLQTMALNRVPLVVLDIPLLFETGGDARCDAVIVVTAPETIQRQRVLSRPGMTEEKFQAILARQTPDAEKRRRADYLVWSSRGWGEEFRRLKEIVADLRGRTGRKYPYNPNQPR